MARIANYRGRSDEAARLVRRIREREGEDGFGWTPGDSVLLEGLELAVTGSDEGGWAAHAKKAAEMELEHEDRLELLECQAIAALASDRQAAARSLYEQAARLARENQSLMSGRVLRNYARHFGTAAA